MISPMRSAAKAESIAANTVLETMSRRPNEIVRTKPSRSDAVLERAAIALNMRQLGEAERLSSEVLKAERGNARAASLLGQALLAQNRADEAITPLERAARRGDDPALETLYAIALTAAGRREDALRQLRVTTARRPVFPPAFRELASQLDKKGEQAEAIAVLESCLALAPGMVELLVDLAALRLARNERGLARAALSKALAVAPGRPDVLALLAQVMLLEGEYASAADAYRHVLAQRPNEAKVRTDFAVCLMELGERAAGESHLRAVTRDQPQLLLRAIHSLAAARHGRFFLRPSAVAQFLQDDRR
jgi:predicted Zn-dependent protease